MLDLQFSSQARKFLKRLDETNWSRIIQKIEELKKDSFHRKVKKVEGRKEKTFRIRVGNYRILYVIFGDKSLLFISKIDKRPRAY